MKEVRVAAGAGHAWRRRERRIHENDGRTNVRQPIGDGFGVVKGYACAGKQMRKNTGADRGELVQHQGAMGPSAESAFGEYGQHAGAGGGFQDDVARADRGCGQCRECKRQRGGELLQLDLVLGTPRVRGLQGGDLPQHGKNPARSLGAIAGPFENGRTVLPDEQDNGGFRRLVGVFPDPGAGVVAGTE